LGDAGVCEVIKVALMALGSSNITVAIQVLVCALLVDYDSHSLTHTLRHTILLPVP
jgi:hypothetical protein